MTFQNQSKASFLETLTELWASKELQQSQQSKT